MRIAEKQLRRVAVNRNLRQQSGLPEQDGFKVGKAVPLPPDGHCRHTVRKLLKRLRVDAHPEPPEQVALEQLCHISFKMLQLRAKFIGTPSQPFNTS